MSANNGGQAFPNFIQNPMNGYPIEEMVGMTLRDYFAAKAMAAMMIGKPIKLMQEVPAYARQAYDIAEAMLSEREKREQA